MGDIKNNAENIPPSNSTQSLKTDFEPKFPVIIFSHGLSGSRLIYSTFCSSLASYGFVVAAVEHRDRSSSWTYMLETDPNSGKVSEIPIKMLMLGDDEREFKKRNQQNHKRVTECIRALHVLEELNLGQCGPVDKKPKGSKIIVGQNFDWQQFKVSASNFRCELGWHLIQLNWHYQLRIGTSALLFCLDATLTLKTFDPQNR